MSLPLCSIFAALLPAWARSSRCRLKGLDDKGKTRNGECVFDQVIAGGRLCAPCVKAARTIAPAVLSQGGYFIVNGSEKVIIAQERQAYNRVYCFHKKAPSKLSWVAEIRSQVGCLASWAFTAIELHRTP